MSDYFGDIAEQDGFGNLKSVRNTYTIVEKTGGDGLLYRNNLGVISYNRYAMDRFCDCAFLKRYDRLIGVAKSNDCCYETGKCYTVVYSDGIITPSDERVRLMVQHEPNEYVATKDILTLGTLNLTAANRMVFDRLVHIKRIGIITLATVALQEVINVKDKTGVAFLNNATAGQITFAANDAPGTFYEFSTDYITDKLYVKAAADVANNTGKAVLYVVYEPQDTVELSYHSLNMSSTDAGYVMSPTEVDATLDSVENAYGVSAALGNAARFQVYRSIRISNPAGGDIAQAMVVDASAPGAVWALVADAAAKVFKGNHLVLVHSTAGAAVKAITKVRCKFVTNAN